MARQEQVRLVDDVDGSPAAVTVTFGLDGQTYELDLSDDHAAELRALFAPYVEVGRRSGSDEGPSPRWSPSRTRTSVTDNAAIRTWARQHGIAVSRRGRISDHVRRAYAERGVTTRQEPDPQQLQPPNGRQPGGLPPVSNPFAVPATG